MVRSGVSTAILSIIFFVGVSGMSSFDRRNDYVNVTEYPAEFCKRTCVPNDKRICYLKFVLENYQAMGVACGKCAQGVVKDCDTPQCIVGDGTEKGVMSINRQVPGPAINVCQGDRIVVDVVNQAGGSASAIHWHGMHMRATPYMDGVPYVTQCPNLFGSTFRYMFDATEPGTHFYHSHSGHHKVNGQYGALVVRQPDEMTANIKEYDYDLVEHCIVISDWMHPYGEQLFPGLPSTVTGPDSLLLNGRGTYTNPNTLERTRVPARIFYVKPGKKYRFRIINAISHTLQASLQIQGHSMKVIASDSFSVEPSDYQTINSNAGERYDFVLTANHTAGDFWIKVGGVGKSNKMNSYALLRYETGDAFADAEKNQPPFPNYDEIFPSGKMLNDPSATCALGTDNSCVTELSAIEEDEELRTQTPDQQIFLGFGNIKVPTSEIFTPGHYPHFTSLGSSLTFVGAINNISVVFPPSPPLTQPSDIDESLFCNESHLPSECNGKTYCPCIHRIFIEKDSLVEMVIVDEAAGANIVNHPFHLHGYKFMVTGLGYHPLSIPMTLSAAKQIESSNGLSRKYKNKPPFKDTLSIPNRGYGVLRFRANNPGFWIMHCHYEWHLASGMGLVLQVGNTDEMVKAPADFPKCNNYLPKMKLPSN